MYNTFLPQGLAEERVKDAMREAEQARLIRVAKGPRKSRGWWLPAALILNSLLALFNAIAELMNHVTGLGPLHRVRPR